MRNNICESTLRDWMQKEEKLRYVYENPKPKIKKRKKRIPKQREKSYKVYSLAEKLDIIAKIKTFSSVCAAGRDLGISETTLRTWIKAEAQMRETWANDTFANSMIKKSKLNKQKREAKQKKKSENSALSSSEIRSAMDSLFGPSGSASALGEASTSAVTAAQESVPPGADLHSFGEEGYPDNHDNNDPDTNDESLDSENDYYSKGHVERIIIKEEPLDDEILIAALDDEKQKDLES